MTVHLDDVKSALADGPTVLLVRHAHRGEITDPRTGNDVPITEQGRALAVELGTMLGALLRADDRVVLAHSPVLRCGQTATAIHAGLAATTRSATVVGERGHLGGPYLLSPKPALDLAAELGHRFLRRWFDGDVPPGLVRPRPDAAREQVERALELLETPDRPRLAVLVSHDWNLMLVREHYMGVRHEEAGWIDFLDGVAIRRGGAGVAIGYRGRMVRVATMPERHEPDSGAA